MIKLKSLISEYVLEPITYLGRYLQQTDKEKGVELAYEFANDLLFDYLRNLEDKNLIPSEYDESDSYEILDYLREKNPKIFDAFAEYVLIKFRKYPDSMHNWNHGAGYPSWSYLDFTRYIKNQWLIHFSDHASDIWREQKFSYGMSEPETLGLTTYHSQKSKSGGYNFAFTLSDYQKYGKNRNSYNVGGWKYGKEAVVFRASGVKTWHNGDEEPQVIFWGPSAKDIVLIENLDGDWGVSSKTGRVIYKSENLSDIEEWIVNNFNQYRHVLIP